MYRGDANRIVAETREGKLRLLDIPPMFTTDIGGCFAFKCLFIQFIINEDEFVVRLGCAVVYVYTLKHIVSRKITLFGLVCGTTRY